MNDSAKHKPQTAGDLDVWARETAAAFPLPQPEVADRLVALLCRTSTSGVSTLRNAA